ncbi:MAG: tetratricopeptide (TPR) repeat protein [Phenylobacterium sp.]|jgi:tetratricopeptide (TPR) repeat protein
MSSKRAHSAFTPSQRSPESLEALFVVREPIAERIIEGIKESALTANKHNALLVGPRGIGKTHLISIINNRLTADKSLTEHLKIAWLPEDPYLASYNNLLLQIIQTLDKTAANADLNSGFKRKLDQLLDLNSSEQQIFAERLLLDQVGDKTLLIIAENMDDLLKNIEVDGQHKLRSLIQTHPVFTILGSATTLSDATSNKTFPFYGFFNTRLLTPFKVEDAVTMLTHLAESEGNQPLADILNSSMGIARIQALHYLAGGNPRIYTVFFDCLTCETLDNLIVPFMKLIDNMTPYYQSHMKGLAPLQRNIIDALRKIRGATTVKEISRQIMREQTAVSPQLNKLEKLGYVERILSSGRNNYYELREPLMRLCLEIKEQRGESIELFIEFLRIWHSPKELDILLTDDSHCDYLCEAIQRAQQFPDPLTKVFDEKTKDYWDPNHDKQTLKHIEAALERNPDDVEYWIRKALCLRVDGHNFETQLTCWQQVTRRDPDNTNAWHCQAILYDNLNKPEQAQIDIAKAIKLAPDNAELHIDYARYLFKLKKVRRAKIEMNKGFELQGQPKTAVQWVQRGHFHYTMNNPQEAKAAFFNALLADYEYEPAWNYLGGTLNKLGFYRYKGKLSQWAASTIPQNELIHKYSGLAFLNSGETTKALSAFQHSIKILNDNKVDANNKDYAQITAYLAYCFNQLGQHNKALQVLTSENDEPVSDSICPFERNIEYAHTLLNLDKWEEGLEQLKATLKANQQLPTFPISIFWPIYALINRTQNKEKWRRYITAYIESFAEINQLPILGQIIVRSLHKYHLPSVTNEVAQAWNDTWQTLGANIKAFTIPLRLLNAATNYKITSNKKALLTLPREERGLLTPWFTNLMGEGEAGIQLSGEIDNLLAQLDQQHAKKLKTSHSQNNQ